MSPESQSPSAETAASTAVRAPVADERESPARGVNPSASRFLFVGGCARSGTTLVQKMLLAHSQVVGGPEFDLLRPIMQLFEKIRSPQQAARNEWYFSPDEARAAVRRFVETLFLRTAQRKPGALWISEKSPSNIDVCETLLDLFPDAVYINVTRDGRDVLASYRQVRDRLVAAQGARARRWLDEYSVRTVSRQWSRNIDSYFQAAGKGGFNARILNVHYEQLVTTTEPVVRGMLEFVGLPFEPGVLAPEEVDPQATGQQGNIDGVWYTQKMFGQRVSADSVGRWTSVLTWPQRFTANVLMCEQLEKCGYDVPAWPKRVHGLLQRLRGR